MAISNPNERMMRVLQATPAQLAAIDSVLEGTSQNRDGGYVFRLEDDSRWTQVDDRSFALEPRRGEKVVVRRAALGSYMLTVGRQPGVRVQRLN